MKEAAGEANMTVVTIVLIAAVVAIATPVITSTIKGVGRKSCCQSYGGVYKNNKCYSVNDNGQTGNEISQDTYWDTANNTCKD